MKKLLTLLFSFTAAAAFAQAPGIQWQKTLGGSAEEIAYCARQTSDGGYIMAGSSKSNDGDVSGNKGDADFWVVKTDGNGAITWQQTYGGSAFDGAGMIEQTTDGGYVVVGTTASTDGDVFDIRGDKDFWVIKLSSGGALQWKQCIGGRYDDIGQSIHQTTDGGYIVSGFTSSTNGDVSGGGYHGGAYDAWVVKLNSGGTVEWNKCLGGGDKDYGREARQTKDGGYIVVSVTASADGNITNNHGGYEAWVVKLGNNGAVGQAPTIQWQRCLGGSGAEDGYAIQQTLDGGYIMAGKTTSSDGDVSFNHGNDDCWIVKLDSNGATQWEKALGGTDYEAARAIYLAPGGGYIVAGYSLSNNGNVSGHHGSSSKNDYWVVKLNSSGDVVWQESVGGTDEEFGFCVEPTSDGGYIVGGYTYSTDGDVTSRHTDAEYWMVKLNPDPTAVSDLHTNEGFSLSPNPATTEMFLQSKEAIRAVWMTDISGKEVFRGGNTTVIPTAALANGLYFVRVQRASGIATQKVMVQH